MPNLSGLTAINVAIGLAALFFVLATALSAINEAIANVLGWRAKTLEDGGRSIIGEPAKRRSVTDVVKSGAHEFRIRPARQTPLDAAPGAKPLTTVEAVPLKTET